MPFRKNIRRNTDIIRHFWIISKCAVGKIFLKTLALEIKETLSPTFSNFHALLSGSGPELSEPSYLWFPNSAARAEKVDSEMNTSQLSTQSFHIRGLIDEDRGTFSAEMQDSSS